MQIGKNRFLTDALEDAGAKLSFFPSTGGSLKRSEVRRALNNSDHLLLLWDGRGFTELLFEARLAGLPTKVNTIEVTEVVNRDRNEPFDAYVGRGTPWGNPFHVGKQDGQYERDEAIEKYRQHFREKILTDESLRKGLLSLRGLRIACHCKPLACHGDVIAEYLNALDPDIDIEVRKPIMATYQFYRDPQSVFGFASTNRASTDAINVLKKWQSAVRHRAYEVLRDEPDECDVLEARVSCEAEDTTAGDQLTVLCLEHGLGRTLVSH